MVVPGGSVALLEVAEPDEPSVANRPPRVFRSDRPVDRRSAVGQSAYRYLPRSVAYLPSHAELSALFEQAGFQPVTQTLLAPGSAQLLVTRKPARHHARHTRHMSSTPSTAGLQAHSWRLDGDLDPLDVAGLDGMVWEDGSTGEWIGARGIAASRGVARGTPRWRGER